MNLERMLGIEKVIRINVIKLIKEKKKKLKEEEKSLDNFYAIKMIHGIRR